MIDEQLASGNFGQAQAKAKKKAASADDEVDELDEDAYEEQPTATAGSKKKGKQRELVLQFS